MPGPALPARLAARSLVVLSLVGGALVVAAEAPAHAVTSHRPLNDTRGAVTGPVSVGFPVEYVGVVAQLPPGAHLPESGPAPYGEVRFSVRGRWSGWRSFGQDGAQAAGTFTSSLVSADRADAYQVRGLPTAGRAWRDWRRACRRARARRRSGWRRARPPLRRREQ